MQTVRNALIVFALGFIAVMASYWLSQSIAGAQVAAPLDAGPVTSDIAVAPAPSAPPVLDPVAQPAETASAVMRLWRGGQIPAALVLLGFAVAALLRKHVGWFSKGRQAAVFGSLLAGLSMLVTDQLVAGQTPNLGMVMSAAIAAVALYLRGEKAVQG